MRGARAQNLEGTSQSRASKPPCIEDPPGWGPPLFSVSLSMPEDPAMGLGQAAGELPGSQVTGGGEESSPTSWSGL